MGLLRHLLAGPRLRRIRHRLPVRRNHRPRFARGWRCCHFRMPFAYRVRSARLRRLEELRLRALVPSRRCRSFAQRRLRPLAPAAHRFRQYSYLPPRHRRDSDFGRLGRLAEMNAVRHPVRCRPADRCGRHPLRAVRGCLRHWFRSRARPWHYLRRTSSNSVRQAGCRELLEVSRSLRFHSWVVRSRDWR